MPRTYNPFKRVYYKNVAKVAGGLAVGLSIFYYLVLMGAIQVTGYSGDMECAGSETEPCYAYINFTALKDVYIYPNESWMFSTNPSVKKIVLQRRWGNYWRTINLSKPWSKRVKYAVKFSMGQSYQIRFVGYRQHPFGDIKWSFGDIDPVWKGVQIDHELIENTDKCLQDCHLRFRFRINKSLVVSKESDWLRKFVKARNALDLKSSGFRILKNVSYNESEWITNISCENITLPNGSIYLNCTGGYYEITEKTKGVYRDFNLSEIQSRPTNGTR